MKKVKIKPKRQSIINKSEFKAEFEKLQDYLEKKKYTNVETRLLCSTVIEWLNYKRKLPPIEIIEVLAGFTKNVKKKS